MRFILVDTILRLDPGKSIEAEKTFPYSEQFFLDHFPGFPVVPGVLLTEAMAQTAGKCLYAGDPDRGRPMLAQIRNASFRNWVKPEERMHIFAEILSGTTSFATAKCRLEVDQKLAAQSELLFSFAVESLFAQDYADQVLQDYLNSNSLKD
jgi:3-hydroxyacyl-[acyl-carrier-protein] dehydratase